ncbi:Hypothetical protein BQ3484_65 [Cedratvirus A11]|uniref:Uncharacterized protein n=1 Tax=Cedratvirus A11 TaxID=1903266 RepID=A0A1M7XTX2_9VIRU|nr:Hypothetical protein BQ3484_65 [Cedratvirus A11]SHO33133.1 Hypothetical protein BQ3484_65 [Cedratvirus A11]
MFLSDAIFFSVMCCSEARNLCTLSSLRVQTRSIFTRKSFWKAKFAFLGIQHSKPNLPVYLYCLKLEKKFLGRATGLLFYSEINLDILGGTNVQEIRSKLNSTRSGGSLAEYTFWLNQMQCLFSRYLVIEPREGGYNISKMREPYLSGLRKTEALNVLLKLCLGV